MQETVDIKRKVLEENEKVHDRAAKTHTRSVPYQCRRITRNYIWNLITEQLKQNNVDPQNANVLEVACGTGTFVELFNKLGSKSYTGIDISSEMIHLAQENNKYGYAKFVKSSLENFAQNNLVKYDIIISSSFLHHLYNFEEGIIQIKNMLKPGGIYIGLHEFIKDRKLTKLEIFDYHFAYLMGYMGGVRISLWKRLCGFIKYMLNDFNILTKKGNQEKLKWKLFNILPIYKIKYIQQVNRYRHYLFGFLPITSSKINTHVDEPFNSDFNYVDYQLNFKFNLGTNDTAKKYGRVIPYCYYNFAELRYLNKVNNHDMFVMTRRLDEILNTWLENFEYNADMVQRLTNMLSLVNMDEVKSIADLGCGTQYLRGVLDEYGWSGEYVGLDLYQHKESTVLCDFNKGQFALEGSYDLIVIAGLLEYIYDLESFLNKVKAAAGKYILLSYIFYELAQKRSKIWMPLISQKALLDAILASQDFSLMKVMPDPLHPEPNTTLYMLFKRNEE